MYIFNHETSHFVTGQDSRSVEHLYMTREGRGFESGFCRWNLSSSCVIFFLLIEDEDFSESRTKIGLSVDKFTTTKLQKYCSYSRCHLLCM